MPFPFPSVPRRTVLARLILAPGLVGIALHVLALAAQAASSSKPETPIDPDLMFKADSLKRVIERRTYSDADKKEIRACDREKSEFLKQARGANPDYAKTDKGLNEAKLAGGDLNDPAIQALLQKKFSYEKDFDDRYMATARGKQCAEGEVRRRKAVAAALEKDKAYQALLRRIAASSPDHL